MNQDLTVGRPQSVLWKFCLPLFGSVIFQQLYNIADSWIAGKFIGEQALAAVGNSYEITLIFIAFATGCNIGTSVIVSRFFGAKKLRDMKTAVYTAMIASGVLCGLLMLLGLLLGGRLLGLIDTPREVFGDSKLYLDIYVLGLPFLFFYNIATGIFSALGDSKTPFYFLAVSSTANIAVDALFVCVFQMGVAGVAWATFLCQGVSCVLAMAAVLRRLSKVQTGEKVPLFSRTMLRQIAHLAVPSIFQQSFISVSNIMIQSIINGYGPGVMAGYSAAIKLNNLVISSLMTMGNGISNYTGQNLGAGKPERVKAGFRAGLKMDWLLLIPVVALYLLAGRPLVGFFMEDPSRDALNAGAQFLTIVSPFYLLICVKLVSDGVLRGAGRMKEFMASTLSDMVLRVAFAYILSHFFQVPGIWSAWPLGWAAGVAISCRYYRKGTWNRLGTGGETSENVESSTDPKACEK